jgi:hypothetical protein
MAFNKPRFDRPKRLQAIFANRQFSGVPRIDTVIENRADFLPQTNNGMSVAIDGA